MAKRLRLSLLSLIGLSITTALSQDPAFSQNTAFSSQDTTSSQNSASQQSGAATYDFVVVGGGTAGLAVATRLAQKGKYTVAVLEAGGPQDPGNSGINIPGLAGSTFGSAIDWAYQIVPQQNANNVTLAYPRGKVLGGSSAINFMLNTKADQADYDAIQAIGNPGWNWYVFNAAIRKAEHLLSPLALFNYTFTAAFHGLTGPVASSFPNYVPQQFQSFFPAAQAVGHTLTQDAFGGSATGAWIYPSAINNTGVPVRVTSNTAYYVPNAALSNLHIFTNAYATTLTASTTIFNLQLITGVRYTQGGTNNLIKARKQVVLSAGSIETPALLERSGFGDQNLLNSLGINTLVNIPGVGNNLADHACTLGTYRLQPGFVSSDTLNFNQTFLQEALAQYGAGTGILTSCLSVADYEPLSKVVKSSDLNQGLQYLNNPPAGMNTTEFNAIVNRIKNGNAVEFLLLNTYFEDLNAPDLNQAYISLATCIQHPLSRGSVHISSPDPTVKPNIDPNYWSHPFDLWLASKAAQQGRQIMLQPAFSHIIKNEAYPGPSVQTDAQWLDATRSRVRTEYHPIGTASMKPLSMGGVVDPTLLVHGTANLRIVDASVIPLHISAHPTMTIYGIAELAAQIILALTF